MRKVIVVLLGLWLCLVTTSAWAQAVPVWDGGFEAEPLIGDNVSAGPSEFWALKGGISERLDVQHHFGTVTDFDDNGFHRIGSAYAMLEATDCTAVAIGDHDDGRLCWEDDSDRMFIIDGGAWEEARPVPQFSLIIWPLNTAPDCAGVNQPDACPCGYTEFGLMENLMPIGANTGGGDAAIPDSAFVACDNEFGHGVVGGAANCNAAGGVTAYDASIDINELAVHDHEIDMHTNADTGGGLDVASPGAVGVMNTENTGSGQGHYHPFFTVLFCQKL